MISITLSTAPFQAAPITILFTPCLDKKRQLTCLPAPSLTHSHLMLLPELFFKNHVRPQKIYLEPLLRLPTAYRINRHASDWHTRPYAMEPKVIVTNCYTIREEGMASHPSILAWRSPVDRGARGLQSLGWQRAGQD